VARTPVEPLPQCDPPLEDLLERLTITLGHYACSLPITRSRGCFAVAEPAEANGDNCGVECSAASGVGVLPNTAAAPGMECAGSCGQLEGGTKLDHYAGRLSIGGRPHYLAPDGHDIGRAGTLRSQGALEGTLMSSQSSALFA